MPPIFALGFLSLPMLGWMAAAAAPILIHLWARRHYRQTNWAAMEFLLAAIRRHTRRIFFEQWLLLLIRTAIIVFLVLAVAGLYWRRQGLASHGGGITHRLLVLDASLSMNLKPGDQTLFEKAKDLARRIVDDSPEGDPFTLVSMSSPTRVAIDKPVMHHAQIIREIEALEPAHTPADLPAALRTAEQLLAKTRHENPGIARDEVYFLTDLQRVTWAPKLGQDTASEFRRQAAALADAAEIVILDLGQADAENLAVTSFTAGDPGVVAGRDVSLAATLKTFGPQTRARQGVELIVDGRRADRKSVDVAPGGETTVNFAYRFETPGQHALEIVAPGDSLDEDNHRYLALDVRQAIRVLCIDGRPAGRDFAGAADYLAEALAPQGDDARATAVKPDIAPESALLERELAHYDCIFLSNVAQFTPHETAVLHNYLQSGGNLVFFLGDQVLTERYNAELGDCPNPPQADGTVPLNQHNSRVNENGTVPFAQRFPQQGRAGEGRILPARLGTLVDQPQLRLDPLGFKHPILQIFRAPGDAGLLTAPVLKYFKLQLPKDSSAQVVLATANGDPLLVEEKIGRGRVVLFATSADTSWSAMPLWPGFLPLVQEIVAYCLEGNAKLRNVQLGDPIAAPATPAWANVPVTMQLPDGRTQRAQWANPPATNLLQFANTTQSGIYTARFAAPIDGSLLFAVNVDTVESDLARLSPGELQADVWPGAAVLPQSAWQNAAHSPLATSLAPAGLQAELLYTVLALLFLETFLAWLFGRGWSLR